MSKIGEYAGIEVVLTPESYKEAIKQKTIYENEILNELQNQNIELQERIDKAIEYIENEAITESLHTDHTYITIQKEELLDILTGGNE